jgi:DNA-binding NarL/FixJ family response regulator
MKRCLVLEDHPDSQAWLSGALHDAFGAPQVDIAGTVAKAMDYLATTAYDIALVDLQLPDGSGVEVIRHINRHSENTLCIVASIFDDDRHLFPALQAGAQGYLLKESAQHTLVTELQGIAAGRPPLSPAIARRLLSHFTASKQEQDPLLTPRESEVLGLVGKGIRLAQISEALGISRHTTADHVKNIYRKLNIHSRAEAAAEAIKRGLT